MREVEENLRLRRELLTQEGGTHSENIYGNLLKGYKGTRSDFFALLGAFFILFVEPKNDRDQRY
jgi:hypothetical protein